ncbi:hypothetical protein D9M72_586870 [compost metagenome]
MLKTILVGDRAAVNNRDADRGGRHGCRPDVGRHRIGHAGKGVVLELYVVID